MGLVLCFISHYLLPNLSLSFSLFPKYFPANFSKFSKVILLNIIYLLLHSKSRIGWDDPRRWEPLDFPEESSVEIFRTSMEWRVRGWEAITAEKLRGFS